MTAARKLIAEGRKHDEAFDDEDGNCISWLRNNLRALLDGYEAALDQIKSDRALIDEQWRELAKLRGAAKP